MKTINRPSGPGRLRTPDLGVSWEGRPDELIAQAGPVVDTVEVSPDCLRSRRRNGTGIDHRHLDALHHFLDLCPGHTVSIHGIGLSLGTAGGWNDEYLELLGELVDGLPRDRIRWHSEHLGFTTIDRRPLGTMPALTCTAAAVELVVERAIRLQALIGLPLLLEHVASPLRRNDDMPLAAFLNEIAERAGCGLILDLHNIACDVTNGLVDADEFFAHLDRRWVREIHVAGGVWGSGLRFDVHSTLVPDDVMAMLVDVAPTCPDLDLVVFELLAEAVPFVGIPGVLDQLAYLKGVLDDCGLARSSAA